VCYGNHAILLLEFWNRRNLVRYAGAGPSWASNTPGQGTAPYRLIMQNDGNLVLYDSNDSIIFQTGTSDGSNVDEDKSLSAGSCDGSCIDCAPGTFKNLDGEESCTDCELGTFTDAMGASACLQCAPGQ